MSEIDKIQHEEYSLIQLKSNIQKILTKSNVFIKSPVVCGVYILYDGDQIVYVGKSSDVHKRITQHTDKTYTCYRVIECDEEVNGMLERMLIEFFLPRYNNDPTTMNFLSFISERSNRAANVMMKFFPPDFSDPNNPFHVLYKKNNL